MMLKIEFQPPSNGDRWPEADRALRIFSNPEGMQKGDVISFFTYASCCDLHPIKTSPLQIKEKVLGELPDGMHALIGNMGCEYTCRHVTGNRATKNIRYMLEWADKAYSYLGERLVLGPLDMDIIEDVWTGGRLLRWAAENDVPLLIFCGYRFLFEEDAFPHIKQVSEQYSFKNCHNPYGYPYLKISEMIKGTGAEVWTGAGFHEGVAAGVLEKAEEFGYSAVFTTRAAWEKGFELLKGTQD